MPRQNQYGDKTSDLDTDYNEQDANMPQAIIDIGLHINKIEVTTVGEIRRTFPHYDHIVWDVLKDLKLDGLCNYDEHSPLPTKVTNKPMQRAMPRHWNNSALYAKTGIDSRTVPDSYETRDRVTA